MTKQISIQEAVALVKDGMTVMIGGFLAAGGPNAIMDALVETEVKDLTIICNDTAFVDKGIGKLIVAKKVKKMIVSHVGTNKETGNQYNAGTLEVEFVPQGTLAERIRCGGAGLGGFYTPVGVGTVIAEGKEIKTINGKTYLLELPLRADIAFLGADTADCAGNLRYHGTARNFNPVMAYAADVVVAEVNNILPTGFISPDDVHTPGIYVKHLVKA